MLLETRTGGSKRKQRERERLTGRQPVVPQRTWYRPCKMVGEFIIALILLVLTGPLILLAAGLVRLTSRGPGFYHQTRLGRYGRLYSIHKIRTMVHDCEARTGPCWSQPGDPRVTGVGHFLRASHIDELPQLWNVLRGEMSLVGPRPERPEFVPQLERAIHDYRNRLEVRPGVTGLAQLHVPPDANLASVRRKLKYDLYYVRRMNPWLDLKILLCTAFNALGVPIRFAHKLFQVPTREVVEGAFDELSGLAANAPQIEVV